MNSKKIWMWLFPITLVFAVIRNPILFALHGMVIMANMGIWPYFAALGSVSLVVGGFTYWLWHCAYKKRGNKLLIFFTILKIPFLLEGVFYLLGVVNLIINKPVETLTILFTTLIFLSLLLDAAWVFLSAKVYKLNKRYTIDSSRVQY